MLELVASDVAQHGAHSSIASALGLMERKYCSERFAHAAFDGIVERRRLIDVLRDALERSRQTTAGEGCPALTGRRNALPPADPSSELTRYWMAS